MGALTNETYYDLIMQGHKESLNAFECSYKEAEYDHEHTVELFNDPNLHYKSQFKKLDNFILYRKQNSLNAKAYYRFVLYLQRQQKIFERDYFVSEIDFLTRCVDALNVKIDLEVTRYPNFKPKSTKGEFGGVTTEGNRFERLIDSLVYYKVFISQLIDNLNNAEQVKNEPQQPETKTEQEREKIKAPVLALFCSLINEIGIDKQEETESAEKYCTRICKKYKLPYKDRVRQNYYGSKTTETRKEFTDKVLPLLDAETKSKIQKHLDTKQPPKQNLYA